MTKRKKPQPQNIPAIQNAEVIPQDDKFENSFSEAIGIGGGVNPNFPFGDSIAGIPGSAQVENVGTIFRNLRWYLISNMRQVLSQAYVEIGLVQTICDVPVDDALRGGINIKSKQLEESQLEELISTIDRDGDLIEVGQAAKWNRLFGGAGILVLTDQDPEEPLDWDSLEDEKVDFRAVDMWELFWDKQNTEDTDLSGNLEEFEFYNYYGEHVHKSRVLRIKGLTAPSFIRPRLRGWGFSVVEILVRSINQYLKGTDLAFEVLDEFKVDVYKIKNLVQSLMSPQGEAAIKKRIQIANWQKNYQNALTMDSEDDWDHKQLSFQGLGDAMMQIRMQVAADMRMPITKLFGISAAGFNSGEDDIEVYNAMVEAQVRNKIKQVIVKMVEIKCQCLFGFVPDDLSVEFEPLRIMSSEQEETVKTQQFNRLLQSLQSGAMSLKEFRAACNKAQLFDVTLDVEDANLEKAYEAAKKAEMGGGKEDGESGADSEKGSGNGDKPRKEKPDTPDKEKPKTATAEKPKKQLANDFDESKVKRDDDGKFSTKGGGSSDREAPTKKRRPGKLEVSDNWNVTGSFHARDGEKGEDGYSCDHCGKGIKRIVTMSSPDHDTVSVGADCAEALVEGTAKQRLDEFYDKQKKEAKKQKAERKAEIEKNVSFEMQKWDTTNKKDNVENLKFLSKAISEAAYHFETGTRLSPRIDPDSIDTKQKWKLLKEALKMQAVGERGTAFQLDSEMPEGAKLRGATTDWATYLVPLLDKMASKKQNTLFIMPRPYTPGQLAKRAILNSARFDRKSYEADGGDNWIEPKRKHFFDREKADDKGLWDRATQASRDSLGKVHWQFQVWYYKKHGGRFGSGGR